jgi:hypothetical protein
MRINGSNQNLIMFKELKEVLKFTFYGIQFVTLHLGIL